MIRLSQAGSDTHNLQYSVQCQGPVFSSLPHYLPLHSHTCPSNNHLQLPRISKRVLDDLVARDQDILALIVVLLLGKVYPAVLDNPAGFAREVDDAAFRVEEEEGLGV